MCAVVGAILYPLRIAEAQAAQEILNFIWDHSHQRGRDGRGYVIQAPDGIREDKETTHLPSIRPYLHVGDCLTRVSIIGNLRAEPTTEYVMDKNQDDQQPYRAGGWSIVHNGTVANDKELRTGEVPTKIDSAAIAELLASSKTKPVLSEFVKAIDQIKGSYAILALQEENQSLFVAANYRPVWYIVTAVGTFLASSRHYFPPEYIPQMMQPYSAAEFGPAGPRSSQSLYSCSGANNWALVVCSGGLDSVVSAVYAQKVLRKEVELIHFEYGSRAEGPEVKAVQAIAKELGVNLKLFPLPVYSKGDSPLLDSDSKVAGGEEGAEFAHEWVPARNLLLLSVATAYAEAHGFGSIILGNNLEEAGAYPDNEQEFVERFNDMLPFAVGDGKRVEVLMPVGNLMKHEIVRLGLDLGAPLHLTWSCYRAGEHHCGKCGPCFMRRTAFKINGTDEVIHYEDEL